MDQYVFLEWFNEPRAIFKDQNGRERIIFRENGGGHKITEEHHAQLKNLQTSHKFCHPILPNYVNRVTAT